MKQPNICELRKIADIFAFPLFVLLLWYLYSKSKRTLIENVLLFFATVGMVADLVFSVEFLTSNRQC